MADTETHELKPRCPTCHRVVRRWFQRGATIYGWCGKHPCKPAGLYSGLIWAGHKQESMPHSW